jgi:RNA polymerase sigma-70 factor (ECF subfamily)
MCDADDRQLITQIKAGQREALRQLVEKYKKPLYRVCFNMTGNHRDAEDISQETFIKVYQKIDQFRMDSRLLTWIYRIAANKYIDRKRKKILDTIPIETPGSVETKTGFEPVSNDTNLHPESHIESEMIQKHINHALNQLSPREKTAFVMKHYDDLTIKEIAGIINTTEGTVKSLLFRAVRKMQSALSFYRNELGLEDV